MGSFDLPFPMLWDASGDSWAALRVPRQPAAMLFDADGEYIDGWQGAIPEDTVLELVGATTTD